MHGEQANYFLETCIFFQKHLFRVVKMVYYERLVGLLYIRCLTLKVVIA